MMWGRNAKKLSGSLRGGQMDTETGKTRKYVHTTVIHLGHAQQSYILTGHGLKHVLNRHLSKIFLAMTGFS